MANSVQAIALDKLAVHPDNANKMSEVNFAKLVRNIEGTGRYEPLIVRPGPEREGFFQIINGEHRYRALAKLGYERADCIVWDIDDEQTDILLATLNRLCGTDSLSKKLKVLKRLRRKMETKELAKLLPQSAKQIERLSSMLPSTLLGAGDTRYSMLEGYKPKGLAEAVVFFVNEAQKKIIEEAIAQACEGMDSRLRGNDKETKAGRRAAALARIAEYFLEHLRTESGV